MHALVLGLSLGLAAGITPGPLLLVVVTSTLRSGWRSGAAAACAPLLTDAFVVALTLLLLDRLPDRSIAVLGVGGGLFVVWTGTRTVREARAAILAPAARDVAGSGRSALRTAATVNLLSPHPWVFWATALGPLVVTTARGQVADGVALVTGFYVTLVGAKLAVVGLVAGGRRRLTDAGYRRALAAAGLLLAAAGVVLVVEFGAQLAA